MESLPKLPPWERGRPARNGKAKSRAYDRRFLPWERGRPARNGKAKSRAYDRRSTEASSWGCGVLHEREIRIAGGTPALPGKNDLVSRQLLPITRPLSWERGRSIPPLQCVATGTMRLVRLFRLFVCLEVCQGRSKLDGAGDHNPISGL